MGQMSEGIKRDQGTTTPQVGQEADPHRAGLKSGSMGQEGALVGPLTKKQEELKESLEKLGIKVRNFEDPKELRDAIKALNIEHIVPQEKKTNILLALSKDSFTDYLYGSMTQGSAVKIPLHFHELKACAFDSNPEMGIFKRALLPVSGALWSIPLLFNSSLLTNGGYQFLGGLGALIAGALSVGIFATSRARAIFRKENDKINDSLHLIPEGREALELIRVNKEKIEKSEVKISSAEIVDELLKKTSLALVKLYETRSELNDQHDKAVKNLIRA